MKQKKSAVWEADEEGEGMEAAALASPADALLQAFRSMRRKDHKSRRPYDQVVHQRRNTANSTADEGEELLPPGSSPPYVTMRPGRRRSTARGSGARFSDSVETNYPASDGSFLVPDPWVQRSLQ